MISEDIYVPPVSFTGGATGLYIHIPFCKSKCHYCDFCSFPHPLDATVEGYTKEICRRLGAWGRICCEREFDTVYIGGGTPSLLSDVQAEKIMRTVKNSFRVMEDAEITIEANPATVTGESLANWRALGVNRLSVGVQSASDGELRLLGRPHNFADAEKCVNIARSVGIYNINADLMIGIPEQTLASLTSTLERYVSLDCEHISAYCLSIEKGTRFDARRDKLMLPDDDTVADMYRLVADTLKRAGYEHYEVSNFAKKGYRSRHNTHTWQYREYLGEGVGAYSFLGGERFGNSRDIEAYLRGEDIVCERYRPEGDERMSEYVMLGLRLAEGISEKRFFELFGVEFFDVYGEACRKHIKAGRLVRRDGRIFISPDFVLVGNAILSDIL